MKRIIGVGLVGAICLVLTTAVTGLAGTTGFDILGNANDYHWKVTVPVDVKAWPSTVSGLSVICYAERVDQYGNVTQVAWNGSGIPLVAGAYKGPVTVFVKAVSSDPSTANRIRCEFRADEPSAPEGEIVSADASAPGSTFVGQVIIPLSAN